ncbi:MAG: hypothetical protein ACE5Z5_05515 [Candidatus Bathyarchaeia archaeon]
MVHPSAFESYVKSVNLRRLLKELGASELNMIVREVEHFTAKEAKGRDKVLLSYFGEEGVNRIADYVIDFLL